MASKKKDLFWGRVPVWGLVLVAAAGAAWTRWAAEESPELLVSAFHFLFLLALLLGLRVLGRWHQKRYGKDS